MLVAPTPNQITAACKEARHQLAALSGWVNYNNQISDDQLRAFMTNVLVAVAVAPPQEIIKPIQPKGK